MYNFVWSLFVVMDLMITKELNYLEECPDSEWDDDRYMVLWNYQLLLEREWVKMEDLFFRTDLGATMYVEACNVRH